MTRTVLPLGVGVLALLLASCGKDTDEHRLAKREWLRRVDAVCRDENTEREAVPPLPFDPSSATLSPAQLSEAPRYLVPRLEIADRTTERLEPLGLPDDGANDAKAILDQRQDGRDALVEAIDAARDGDVDKFQKRLGEAEANFGDATELASDFGLTQCGMPS